MAAPYKRTKLIRKRKKRRLGKVRKQSLRSKGSTPALDKILGPLKS